MKTFLTIFATIAIFGCAGWQKVAEDVAEATCPMLCQHVLKMGCGMAADGKMGADEALGTLDDPCGIACDILFGADGLYDMSCAMEAESCEEVSQCGR